MLIPARSTIARTAAKCSASASSRRSSIVGASSITARVPGSSESKARSGFEVDPLAHVRRQLRLAPAQVSLQLVSVGGPGVERAEAAEPQPNARNAELPEQLVEQDDQLGVDQGRVRADRLGADLVELPEAARLRALVAEVRAPVPELHRLGEPVHALLDVGAEIGAVPSGRRVSPRPPWSVELNISFCTMSVDPPTPRANSSLSSNAGVSIRP